MTALTIDGAKAKNYLTPAEMERFLAAARKTRNGVRNFAMMLLCYRHGLRVRELVGLLRVADLDLEAATIHVRRQKGSVSTQQPMAGDELRAVRAWLRIRPVSNSPLLFISTRGPLTRQAVNYLCAQIGELASLGWVHPHMLRHSCGYFLANKGSDTRLIQDWLGHRSINNTMLYTRTCAKRFEGLWE